MVVRAHQRRTAISDPARHERQLELYTSRLHDWLGLSLAYKSNLTLERGRREHGAILRIEPS